MPLELSALRDWWLGVASGSEEHWPFELCAAVLSASLMLAVLLASNASLLHPSFRRTFTGLNGLEQAKLRLAVTIVRATRRNTTDCGGTYVEGANVARRRQFETGAMHEPSINVPRVGVGEVLDNGDDDRVAHSTQPRRIPLSGAIGALAKLRTAVGLKVRDRREAPRFARGKPPLICATPCLLPPCCSQPTSSRRREEGGPVAFCGSWSNVSNDNLEPYLKHIGVGWAKRKVALTFRPQGVWSRQDGVLQVTTPTPLGVRLEMFPLDGAEQADEIEGKTWRKSHLWEGSKLVTRVVDPAGLKPDFVTERWIDEKGRLIQVNSHNGAAFTRIFARTG